MRKNYKILKFEMQETGSDSLMTRYYCFLNRCGRHVLNDPSFHLRLLPLVLERINQNSSHSEGLNQADGLLHFCRIWTRPYDFREGAVRGMNIGISAGFIKRIDC